MIPRYSHPTVSQLWSPLWQYQTWRDIEVATLGAQVKCGIVPPEHALDLILDLGNLVVGADAVTEIGALEQHITHHDVAAFLAWCRPRVRNGRYLHYGLTSSDLVDTTMGLRFKELTGPLKNATRALSQAIGRFMRDDSPVLGWTHGQPAEPTSMRARATGWYASLLGPVDTLRQTTELMAVCKLSGPVGTFAHNPPKVEQSVAREFRLIPMGPGATQIVPRSNLAMWANSAAALLAACAKVATDLRHMHMTEEVWWPRRPGHVGSSAMPHKNNPIEAEQVVGLARLAAGYAQQLQPMTLWMERDISNSSVERVAIPDLWHVLLHTLDKTATTLDTAEFRPLIADANIDKYRYQAWSHKRTLELIGMSYDHRQARDVANQPEGFPVDYDFDARWFVRNYPGTIR